MKNRIDACFEKLKAENKKALVTFITAGTRYICHADHKRHRYAENEIQQIKLHKLPHMPAIDFKKLKNTLFLLRCFKHTSARGIVITK